MPEASFGGAHTEQKLVIIAEYLNRFTTALKYQAFKTIYFDAFAGAGEIKIAEEASLLADVDPFKPIIEGSVKRALAVRTPFSEYVLVDRSTKNIAALRGLTKEFPHLTERIKIIRGDANELLKRFCAEENWRSTRAVIFLDPFGNQVEWPTLEAIAQTQAVDLWYLFPAGLGVHRQISRGGTVDVEKAKSLDRIFGANDWRAVFISAERETDLFGHEQSFKSKIADADAITHFMISCMRSIFKGGVLDEYLPLGSGGVHMYSLIFAWANRRPKARLAATLAHAVMKAKKAK